MCGALITVDISSIFSLINLFPVLLFHKIIDYVNHTNSTVFIFLPHYYGL